MSLPIQTRASLLIEPSDISAAQSPLAGPEVYEGSIFPPLFPVVEGSKFNTSTPYTLGLSLGNWWVAYDVR